MQRKMIVASLMALFLLASVNAFGADKVKGMILTRTGDTLTVSNASGKTIVLLTDETDTKDNTGLFGWGKDHMSNVVLIPGLKLEVEGTVDDQGRIVAKTITVDGDDLETAEMIQAGLHPTAQQVLANERSIAANRTNIAGNKNDIEANQQRIAALEGNLEARQKQIQQSMADIEERTRRFLALSDYDVKDQATVNFDTASSELSASAQEELRRLARGAAPLTGYIIEVMGFADSSGTIAMNQQLSEDRSKAVVNFLMQQCSVPPRRIVAPAAMGIYQPVASNETNAGRAENRRAEIKVLASKATSASGN
jgi:outer membrane protein OmpA-like peptidoglycan-associated protein